MTAVVLALGICKHFNLPAAVTEIGRILANQIGGYEMRRCAQLFILSLIAVGLIPLVQWSASQKAFARIWVRYRPEMICLFYLCGLVILRTISLHQVGALLAADVFGIRINWIIELIPVLSLAVILFMRTITKGASDRSIF